MPVTVYIASVSSNLEMKKRQQKIEMVLTGKKIEFEFFDITSGDEAKAKMRAICGSTSLPPQIANGEQYCGDYENFVEALENEELETFLKL